MKKLLLFLIIPVLVFSSCKKDDEEQNVTPSAPTMNGTTNYGGTYLPIVKGNVWSYDGDQTYVTEVTGIAKVENGDTYYELMAGTQSSLYYEKDGEYHVFMANQIAEINDMILLKENAAIGETWSYTYTTNQGIITKYEMVMNGQVGPITVNQETFDDVIAVDLNTTADYGFGIGEIPVASQTTYYAKDVGMIMQTGNQIGLNVELISYTVK